MDTYIRLVIGADRSGLFILHQRHFVRESISKGAGGDARSATREFYFCLGREKPPSWRVNAGHPATTEQPSGGAVITNNRVWIPELFLPPGDVIPFDQKSTPRPLFTQSRCRADPVLEPARQPNTARGRVTAAGRARAGSAPSSQQIGGIQGRVGLGGSGGRSGSTRPSAVAGRPRASASANPFPHGIVIPGMFDPRRFQISPGARVFPAPRSPPPHTLGHKAPSRALPQRRSAAAQRRECLSCMLRRIQHSEGGTDDGSPVEQASASQRPTRNSAAYHTNRDDALGRTGMGRPGALSGLSACPRSQVPRSGSRAVAVVSI